MALSLKKIHHLIRYFLLLGLLAFIAFNLKWNYDFVLVVMGPPIYVAYGLKKVMMDYVWKIPASAVINSYAFLLPITLVYFGLIGFQFKQLWNERGTIRTFSLLAFIAFLVYIHFAAWHKLTLFLQA